MVFTNYTIQLGYVPRMIAERPAFLGALTMSNPSSFAWFLEMFGYAAMGVATWLVSPLFGGSTRGTAVRVLLIVNALVSVVGAASRRRSKRRRLGNPAVGVLLSADRRIPY